jgi:hypothetical protein
MKSLSFGIGLRFEVLRLYGQNSRENKCVKISVHGDDSTRIDAGRVPCVILETKNIKA